MDRGAQNAQKIHNKVGKTVTGAEFRDGYEALDITDAKLKEIGISGMSAPFKLTCAKHEGAEHFKMMQWDGKKFQIVTDWVPAPDPAFIRKLIEDLGGEVRRREQHHAARRAPDRPRRLLSASRAYFPGDGAVTHPSDGLTQGRLP